jgi:hypothetical protein
MSEEFRITFYRIHKCGFYKTRTNKKIFGSINDTLIGLKRWAEGVELFVDTKLLSEEKADNFGNDVREVYYYDCISKNKTSLIVLWNQLQDIDSEVPTLSKAKKIGDGTTCKITKLPANAIPGTAAYFWFIPEKTCFATIERKERYSNVAGMRLYIQNFLAHRSQYCVLDKESEEIKILGYKNGNTEVVQTDISPYFQVQRALKKGQIEFIKENRTKIRKILRKQKILTKIKPRLDLAKNLLLALGVKKNRNVLDEVRTSFEISMTPTKEELDAIILQWENDGLASIDDTGFLFSGETSVHWLNGEISRIKRDWDVEYLDDEVLKPQKLLDLLLAEKDNLLSVLS